MDCSPPGSSVHRILQASGLPCPPAGSLPDPGIQPVSLLCLAWQVVPLPLEPHGKPYIFIYIHTYMCERLMLTADSLEKSLMLGKIEGRRRRGCQRMRWLEGITDLMDMNLGKLWEIVRVREAWHIVVHGVAKSWIRLGD